MGNHSSASKFPNTAKSFHERTDEFANLAAEKTHEGIKKVGRSVENLANQAEKYNDEISTMITKHPIRTLAIAGAIGAVIGLIIRR